MLGRKTSERHVERRASSSGEEVGVNVASVFDLPRVLLNHRIEVGVRSVCDDFRARRQLRHMWPKG